MKICIISITFASTILFLAGGPLNAMEVNIETYINISTEYKDCEKYADKMSSYMEKYVASKNEQQKSGFWSEVKKNKKKLKKCEKRNRKWQKSTIPSFGGARIGGGFSF